MKNIRLRTRFRNIGSVIVLVVAVLALLAVIGTVYIVSARAERTNATAMQTMLNLDLAFDAINQTYLQRITNDTLDAAGVVGGFNTAAGAFGETIGNTHTMPEFGGIGAIWGYGYAEWMFTITGGVPTPYPTHKDSTWLVSNTYAMPSLAFYDARANEFTLLTQYAYNPAKGNYDSNFPYYKPSTKTPNPFALDATGTAVVPSFRVVNDPLPTALPLPNGATEAPGNDAFMNLLPISEASGIRYRYGLRILDTSRFANINVGDTQSTQSDAYGILGTYFNGYALGQGNGPNDGVFDISGTAPNMGAGAPDAVDSIDSAPGRWGAWNLSGTTWVLGNNGNNGSPSTLFAPRIWQWGRQVLRFEIPGQATPFDLADEMELRARGVLGTVFTPRPASGTAASHLWPNNLGVVNPPGTSVLQGNVRRNFFTDYSYSRELRSYLISSDINNGSTAPDFAYTATPQGQPGLVNPMPNGYVWPPFPARVAAAPDISYYTVDATGAPLTEDEAADTLVFSATNIATAMERIALDNSGKGYTPQEARAFVANYLTYRWNGWSKRTVGGVDVFNLINGPSFVDAQGICFRATLADASGYWRDYGSVTDVTTETTSPNKIYLGYAAQPFINEIAVHEEQVPGPMGPVATITETAVELYNPYNVALDLNDYVIRLNGKASDVHLTNQYIPARGYFVVRTNNVTPPNAFDSQIKGKPTTQDLPVTGFGVNPAGGKAVLLRQYLVRGGASTDFAAVDVYDYSGLLPMALATATAGQNFYIRRDNDDPDPSLYTPATNNDDPVYKGYLGRWIATVPYATATLPHLDGAAPGAMTLGAVNPPPAAPERGLRLYDRYVDQASPVSGFNQLLPQRSPFLNVSDFNHIMRIANEIDTTKDGEPAEPSAMNPADDGSLVEQLGVKIAAPLPQLGDTQFPAEAGIHFDFLSSPWVYNAPNVPADIPSPPPAKTGDIRAVKLLDCLAFVDRVSDFSIDLGDNQSQANGGNRGLSKLRIPGQINVNTASGEVLATLPLFNTGGPGGNYRFVGDIMAYRWRTTHDDLRIPVRYQSTHDYNDPVKFPGYGIRSLGELLVPLSQETGASAATLDDRDLVWSRIYNMCTVRSDTFVVYGYMEAIKANPNAVHNNGTDWYGPAADDPRGAKEPNIRVARRRWVALVDRSEANFNRASLNLPPLPFLDTPPKMNPLFTGARIIAVKDLPN